MKYKTFDIVKDSNSTGYKVSKNGKELVWAKDIEQAKSMIGSLLASEFYQRKLEELQAV